MIYIKAYYGDWTPTTKEKAKKFCDLLMDKMTGTINQEHRIKLINKNHLKGIKYEEL